MVLVGFVCKPGSLVHIEPRKSHEYTLNHKHIYLGTKPRAYPILLEPHSLPSHPAHPRPRSAAAQLTHA